MKTKHKPLGILEELGEGTGLLAYKLICRKLGLPVGRYGCYLTDGHAGPRLTHIPPPYKTYTRQPKTIRVSRHWLYKNLEIRRLLIEAALTQ